MADAGGDSDHPGRGPAEIQPGEGDFDQPNRAPEEEVPGGGDIDQPGSTPPEIVPQPDMPSEAPPPD